MNQPLNLQRSSRWIPPSRYYGDRYARTLEEAFGPYSEWEPEPPTVWQHARGYILTVLIACMLGAVSWALQS